MIPIRKAPTIPYVSNAITECCKCGDSSKRSSNISSTYSSTNDYLESTNTLNKKAFVIGDKKFISSTNSQFLASRCDLINSTED